MFQFNTEQYINLENRYNQYQQKIVGYTMDKKDFKTRTNIIKETFMDDKNIKCHIPTEELELDENIHQEGDFFMTEDGEFVDLEFQFTDFTEDELVKFIELAENLHEKYERKITIYILCPKYINVYVKEIEIMSDADFTIKLCCTNMDPCKVILDGIKNKIKNNEFLDEDDFHALAMLPVMCDKDDKHYYRSESIKIRNRVPY